MPHRYPSDGDGLLITGGRLVTMADGARGGEPGDLLIRNGEIRDILPPGTRVDGAQTISAEGMFVLPGFVDTHRHTWQTQLRTVAADWTLFDYIVRMRSIYSALYTPEDAYLGNLLGALDSVDAGITTIVDHCHLINSPELAGRGKAPRRLCYTTRDALRLATLGGAEALHLERRIGSLERGKAADVILVRADGLHMTPSPDAEAALVLGASPADVDTVLIDGVVRKRHGALVGFDVGQLKRRLADSATRISAEFETIDGTAVEAFWERLFPHLE